MLAETKLAVLHAYKYALHTLKHQPKDSSEQDKHPMARPSRLRVELYIISLECVIRSMDLMTQLALKCVCILTWKETSLLSFYPLDLLFVHSAALKTIRNKQD